MEREIKFRGKRKDNGEWMYGNLFVPNKMVSGVYICPDTTYVNFAPGIEDVVPLIEAIKHGCTLGRFIEVNPETIGEYTGLLDKNDKEIYEGDFINCNESEAGITKREMKNCLVTWSKVLCAYDYCPNGKTSQPHQLICYALSREIIGNKFDNPELLS